MDGHRALLRHRSRRVLAAAARPFDVRAARAALDAALRGRRRTPFRAARRAPLLDAPEDDRARFARSRRRSRDRGAWPRSEGTARDARAGGFRAPRRALESLTR